MYTKDALIRDGIRDLQKNNKQVHVHKHNDGEFLIVRNKKNASYYFIDLADKNQISRGAHASVYYGHEIRFKNGQYGIDEKNPIAIKKSYWKINSNKETLQDPELAKMHQDTVHESKIANAHHQISHLPDPLIYDGNYLVFMKFLPQNSVSLLDRESKIENQDLFNTLSFSQKIQILLSIAISTHEMHNNTLRSDAFAHLDIKPENLRIQIELDGKNNIRNLQTEFCDFGTAQYLKTEDAAQQIRPGKLAITPGYVALEYATERLFGPKTDIFSLAPIFYAILGAHNPLSSRAGNLGVTRDFNKDGLLDPLPPELEAEDRQLIFEFVERMGDMKDYENRPDSFELLEFTTQLWKFCLIKEKAVDGKISFSGYDEQGNPFESLVESKDFTFKKYWEEQQQRLASRKENTVIENTKIEEPVNEIKVSEVSMFRKKADHPLIKEIDKEIKKITENGKFQGNAWADETSRYPQKYNVLNALKSFLSGRMKIDDLENCLGMNQKYKKGGGILGKSETVRLVELVLEENEKRHPRPL
jgi:serine/threonine protein kinase